VQMQTASIADRLLVEARELFRCIFNDSSDAFIIARRHDLRIVDLNGACERLIGLDRAEAMALKDGLRGLPIAPDRFAALRDKLDAEGRLHNEPLTLTPSEGDRRRTRLSAHVIELLGEECALCTFRDMTALVESEARRKRAVDELLTTEESIRAGLALDLHDDALQVLAAVNLELARIEKMLADQGSMDSADAISRIRNVLSECADRTRRLMFQLRPRVLTAEGLGPALTDLASLVTDDGGPAISVDAPDRRFQAVVEELVWRTVREALLNVMRHAHARQVLVTIRESEGSLDCEVRDDGVGFDVVRQSPKRHHVGIASMRERIEGLGGRFSIESSAANGTTVHFVVPLPNAT
jgi:two-component system NarL family sensor kinase